MLILEGLRGRNIVRQSVRDVLQRHVRAVQQVVIEVLPVAAEQARELIELALRDIHLGEVVRVPAKAATEGRQVVEELVLRTRQRVHGKRLA